MPIYALKTSAAWLADASPNGAVFADVADPATISGLTNGTPYQVAEILMSPLSAEFTPTASLLPFVDDFSTDTSAEYTKFGGGANLVVSGGVASSDGAGDGNVLVYRDIGLGSGNASAKITAGANTTGIVSVGMRFTDLSNRLEAVWDGAGTFRIDRRVGGVYTNIPSAAGQTFNSGDTLELVILDGGISAQLFKNGVRINSNLLSDNVDISALPASGLIMLRVASPSTIASLEADNT